MFVQVVADAYFTTAMVEALRKPCPDAKVPWIIGGMTEVERDAYLNAQTGPPEASAVQISGEMKAVLDAVRNVGQWAADGLYAYLYASQEAMEL
jgi:hypothetical protein